MAHIQLPDGVPGIREPMMFRPETAKPMNEGFSQKQVAFESGCQPVGEGH